MFSIHVHTAVQTYFNEIMIDVCIDMAHGWIEQFTYVYISADIRRGQKAFIHVKVDTGADESVIPLYNLKYIFLGCIDEQGHSFNLHPIHTHITVHNGTQVQGIEALDSGIKLAPAARDCHHIHTRWYIIDMP